MKDKSRLIAVVLVIITIVVVVCSYMFSEKKENEDMEINIVTNYSNFYTVSSCIYRTMTYIYNNDYESLMLLLNDKYKQENNISLENISSIFSNIDIDSNFSARKMYYQKINGNITKFYVYGWIEENRLTEDEYINGVERKDIYFIVYMDSKNKTFSIEPYSGDIFIGGVSNER